MIDMHIHILPEFDDGAEDMEEAVEMAWAAVDSGVTAVVAASHVGPHFSPAELQERKKQYMEKLACFREELKKREIPLLVYQGMEILFGDGFMEALLQGYLLTLNNSKYVLIEFFFDEKEEVIRETVQGFQKTEYKMVMAHPERYDCVKRNPGLLEQWKKEGVFYQLNKGSLFGSFGDTVKQTAEWMLYQGLVDVVASDAHDTVERTAGMEELRFLLEEVCGMEEAKRLLLEK